MRQDVIDYCKGDRQWKREHRLAYALDQYRKVKAPKDKEFWDLVVRVNMLTSNTRIPVTE